MINFDEQLMRCLLIDNHLYICEMKQGGESGSHMQELKIAMVLNIDMLKFQIHLP